jgi:hypothetical protein
LSEACGGCNENGMVPCGCKPTVVIVARAPEPLPPPPPPPEEAQPEEDTTWELQL